MLLSISKLFSDKSTCCFASASGGVSVFVWGNPGDRVIQWLYVCCMRVPCDVSARACVRGGCGARAQKFSDLMLSFTEIWRAILIIDHQHQNRLK